MAAAPPAHGSEVGSLGASEARRMADTSRADETDTTVEKDTWCLAPTMALRWPSSARLVAGLRELVCIAILG
jgi:hypothetical protein